jgi:hypothetical protein
MLRYRVELLISTDIPGVPVTWKKQIELKGNCGEMPVTAVPPLTLGLHPTGQFVHTVYGSEAFRGPLPVTGRENIGYKSDSLQCLRH